MNDYINAQIMNMKIMVKTFQQACQLGAIKDDGKIDAIEQRQLKKINSAAERFLRELEDIK